jgi:hypothetical protein
VEVSQAKWAWDAIFLCTEYVCILGCGSRGEGGGHKKITCDEAGVSKGRRTGNVMFFSSRRYKAEASCLA